VSNGGHGGAHGHDEALGGGGAAAAPAINFRLNGDVSLITPSVANTYGGDGVFDAQIPLVVGGVYDSITLYQWLDGAADSTTVELWHFTAGAWAEIALSAALTIAAGGGADVSVTRTFGPITGVAGERFSVQATAVQSSDATDIPTNLVATVFEAP
jgi:hypothetical protein